jgi:hypothetical protein
MALTGAATTTIAGGGAALSTLGAAGAATGIGSAIAGVGAAAAANPLVTSTLLTTGGQMISGYAAGKAEEEAAEDERKRLDKNGSYKLKMGKRDSGSEATDIEGSGATNDLGNVSTDDSGRTQHSDSAIAKVSNVEQMKGQSYYDSSTNTHKQRA